MKKVFLALSVILASCPIVVASNIQLSTTASSSYNPQVCQFSLTKYRGVLNSSGDTECFQVGLSCPQSTEIYATVAIYIDGNLETTKVVKIKAGQTYSENVKFDLHPSMSGKNYELGVQ